MQGTGSGACGKKDQKENQDYGFLAAHGVPPSGLHWQLSSKNVSTVSFSIIREPSVLIVHAFVINYHRHITDGLAVPAFLAAARPSAERRLGGAVHEGYAEGPGPVGLAQGAYLLSSIVPDRSG